MNLCALVNNLVEFHNGGMPEVRQSVYFSMNCHLRFFILQILLIIGLDGDNVLCFFMSCSTYDCKCTLTDLKPNLKLA